MALLADRDQAEAGHYLGTCPNCKAEHYSRCRGMEMKLSKCSECEKEYCDACEDQRVQCEAMACSARLCRECAVQANPDVYFCPAHKDGTCPNCVGFGCDRCAQKSA